MKMHSGLLGALAACMLPFAALAQLPDLGGFGSAAEGEESWREPGDRRAYLSGMFSYTFADDDRDTDDGFGGTVSLGKRFTSGLNLELTGFYSRMDPVEDTNTANQNDANAVELTGIGAAAMIFPSQTLPELYLIFALHQGQATDHTTPKTGNPATRGAPIDYRTTVFDPGIGYVFPLTQYLGGFEMALRAEARYRMDAHTRTDAGVGGRKHFYEAVANIGVQIPLGGQAVEAAPAAVEVVESGDADADGVPDDQDQCPDTAAGASVDGTGCEGDSDGDGVPDSRDTCPDTPAGTPVNEQGCPALLDADGDGVADDADSCPATPAGTAVDETGCPAQQEGCRAPAPGEPINLEGCATGESVVLKGVNFEVNSSRLTVNARAILNQVADSLAAAPAMKVEIGGHTDAQGSDDFNQKLSERRAQAVHDYLVARGIDPSRLSSRGYGESQPIESNETPEGREVNRRVEMKVIEGGGQ
jgi:OmpA-OmpF porin, OOP family